MWYFEKEDGSGMKRNIPASIGVISREDDDPKILLEKRTLALFKRNNKI
jgi:hypothetical protein